MTGSPRRPSTSCANSLEAAVLLDYWLGALPSRDEEKVEEHFLACDACAERLREAIALAESLRTLARSGLLEVVITGQMVERAKKAGVRVREYAPRPGEAVQCTVAADDDLLLAHLTADLTSVSRVDLSWCDTRGVEHRRMTDIPVTAEASGVICQQPIAWAKGAPTKTMVARLLAIEPSGDERLLGEYTFNHTRTIPGPAEW